MAKKTTALATQNSEPSILQTIATVASDPNVNVDVMQRLVDLQLNIMDREQQTELNKALARVEPMLPTLLKTKAGAKTQGGSVKFYYTPYPEIDKVLRPALRECGLSLSFSSDVIGDKLFFVAQVQEVSKGGVRVARIPYSADDNRQLNDPQKIASGLSYAKRATVALLFNLVFEDEDDNAQAAGAITKDQLKRIDELRSQIPKFNEERFLSTYGIASFSELQQGKFNEVIALLEQGVRTRGNKS